MKTKEEIQNELNKTINELKEYHQQYSEGKITFDTMRDISVKSHAKIDTLKWVLGKDKIDYFK